MLDEPADPGLEVLLELDGQVIVIDEEKGYSVRFVVKRVEPSPERPHGLSYALSLHGPDMERLVGYDNAHPVAPTAGPAGRRRRQHDHRHRRRSVRPYDYRDAATLLADFWADVDAVLKERGVLS